MVKNPAVAFAHAVLDMEHKIERLEAEVMRLKHYEEDYHELMRESLAHNERMVGSLFQLAMTPGVLEATAAANSH